MYEYRKMTEQERLETLARRRALRLPLHEPPHYPEGLRTYLISAACFEHRPILALEERRRSFEEYLLDALSEIPAAEVYAWVILPHHYHVLATVEMRALKTALARLHNRTATGFNREDRTMGRKVWYRFSDRRMRSERHYYASLNYVHANPVKHGFVAKATDWACSSVHLWMERYGRPRMIDLWRAYPIRNYGAGWDD